MLSYFFLPSQKATLLLIPYHFTIPPTSKNSIFIKILLFNLSLLFLSIRYFFQRIPFSWAFQPFFFSQAPSTSSTNTNTNTNTNKHKPMSYQSPSLNHNPLPQPYFFSSTTHTNTNHQTHADQKPTPSNQQSHRSKTHAADLKPSRFETHRSKPIQKNHHRSHLSHNLTTTQPRPTTNHPFQPPIHDQ